MFYSCDSEFGNIFKSLFGLQPFLEIHIYTLKNK